MWEERKELIDLQDKIWRDLRRAEFDEPEPKSKIITTKSVTHDTKPLQLVVNHRAHKK